MYVQYNIVHVSFSGQSGPTNTLEKRYVFWILSSMNIDMKGFVYFCRPILPLLQHLSLFLLLLLHTSCSGHSWETIKNALWYWPQPGSASKAFNECGAAVTCSMCVWQQTTGGSTQAVCAQSEQNSSAYLLESATRTSNVEIHRASEQMLMLCRLCRTAGKCDW